MEKPKAPKTLLHPIIDRIVHNLMTFKKMNIDEYDTVIANLEGHLRELKVMRSHPEDFLEKEKIQTEIQKIPKWVYKRLKKVELDRSTFKIEDDGKLKFEYGFIGEDDIPF